MAENKGLLLTAATPPFQGGDRASSLLPSLRTPLDVPSPRLRGRELGESRTSPESFHGELTCHLGSCFIGQSLERAQTRDRDVYCLGAQEKREVWVLVESTGLTDSLMEWLSELSAGKKYKIQQSPALPKCTLRWERETEENNPVRPEFRQRRGALGGSLTWLWRAGEALEKDVHAE